ncbi:hypothetical protein K0U83_01035, partial [bacterium]|nr:hypothetical protein [bacterium]
ARVTQASFSTCLLIVPLSANTLNGDRVMSFASYEDMQDAQTSGYISASTLLAGYAAFNADHTPEAFKVAYIDDTSVSATKAFKDFGTVGTGNFDTTIEAHVAGTAGNSIRIGLVGDSAGAVTISQETISTTVFVYIHYQPGVSTVTNVETAIAALSGAADTIDVKTGGTGATVLAAGDDEFIPTALATGTDASGETAAQAMTAIVDADPDFYGVLYYSRNVAKQTTMAQAVGLTVSGGTRLFGFLSEDATILTASLDSAFDTLMTSERAVGFYAADDTQWNDVAAFVDRLAFDADFFSVPWHGFPLRVVTDYSADITASERAYAIANDFNITLPQGDEDLVVDPGWNAVGRPVYEIVTADWFRVRVQEGINRLIVQKSSRGYKIPVSTGGQAQVAGAIWTVIKTGIAAKHFDADIAQHSVTSEAITASDLENQRFRFTVRVKLAVAGRLVTVTVYASRQPSV